MSRLPYVNQQIVDAISSWLKDCADDVSGYDYHSCTSDVQSGIRACADYITVKHIREHLRKLAKAEVAAKAKAKLTTEKKRR